MSDQHRRIVEEVNTSFAEGNCQRFLDHCAEDVVWTIVGEKTSRGIAAVREFLETMTPSAPPKLTVDRVIADGNDAVCIGEMTMTNKNGGIESYSCCDVYKFDAEKIAELISYVVRTNPTEPEAQN